ncbi:MAG: hypothetical protein PHQ36_04245 [Anaerolineales bacterium]|nr:hypothetical protein [Anaerolineales bacterium]
MEPGLYEIISKVTIRREPRIVEFKHPILKWVSNSVGTLELGDQREVYSIVTDKTNNTWGRISESDASGKALWICLQGLNRSYAKPVNPEKSAPAPVVIVEYPTIETRISKLEDWAKTKGYK